MGALPNAIDLAVATALAPATTAASAAAAAARESTTTTAAAAKKLPQSAAAKTPESYRRGLVVPALRALIGKHRGQQGRHFNRIMILQMENFHFSHIFRAAVNRLHDFHQMPDVRLRVRDDNGIPGVIGDNGRAR